MALSLRATACTQLKISPVVIPAKAGIHGSNQFPKA
jgi:hypothetical protein